MKKIIIVIGHAILGWGLCGATIGIGRNLTSMENALIIHAVAAPVIFAMISMFYFKRANHFSPLSSSALTGFPEFSVLSDILLLPWSHNRFFECFIFLVFFVIVI